MSKQANPSIIGLFLVGAIALIVAGVIVFGSGKFLRKKVQFVLFFEASVKGLNVGAPVDFKGVRVGSVTAIKVFFDEKELSTRIPVYIEIEEDKITEVYEQTSVAKSERIRTLETLLKLMVKQGLRAQLQLQSLLTGLLYVNLDFFPDKPAMYIGAESRYAELPTIQSSLQELSKTLEKLPLEDLANKLVSAVDGIEKFINSPDLEEALSSVKQSANETKKLLHDVHEQIGPLMANGSETLDEAKKALRDVDKEIKPLATGLRDTIKTANGLLAHVDSHVPKLLTNLEDTIKQADKNLSNLEGLTDENSNFRYDLSKTLKELSSAARSIRVMVDYLQQHPETLIQGKSKNGAKEK